MTTKRRYDKIYLDKYVDENEIELIGDNLTEYEKVNRDTRIQGKCKSEGCEGIFEKSFRQIIEKSGPKCHKCSDKRKSYKKADLDKYIEENKIELIGKYEKVNAHTSIQGVCLTENCNNNFNKKFLELVKTNGYCYECSLKNNGREVVFNITFLNKYVDEHKLILLHEYTSTNRDSIIKGKCKTDDCEGIFEKSFRQIFEYSGPYCNGCTNINKGDKCKSTNLERRGVEYPTQSKEVIDLMKKNCNIKYGVDNISQIENIKDKKKNTTKKNYGVEYPSQSIEVKEKSKETCKEKYGVEYTLQSEDVRLKGKQTKLEKYGCETCKINLVYNLFTNLDCERICSDCSNPKRNPKYQKTKEWIVVRKLREDLADIPFIHNKSVGNECTLQDREDTNGHLFPDIRFELFSFDLIVEVDEHRHRGAGYSCDQRRMYDIVAKLGLPCVFIRYNPDDKKSDYNVLLKMIKEYLEKDMDEINFNEDINGHKNDGLKVEYLFYESSKH